MVLLYLVVIFAVVFRFTCVRLVSKVVGSWLERPSPRTSRITERDYFHKENRYRVPHISIHIFVVDCECNVGSVNAQTPRYEGNENVNNVIANLLLLT